MWYGKLSFTTRKAHFFSICFIDYVHWSKIPFVSEIMLIEERLEHFPLMSIVTETGEMLGLRWRLTGKCTFNNIIPTEISSPPLHFWRDIYLWLSLVCLPPILTFTKHFPTGNETSLLYYPLHCTSYSRCDWSMAFLRTFVFPPSLAALIIY